MIKIIFTGGGTGGHIFPIITIIREIRNLYNIENIKFYYIGPPNKKTRKLLEEEGVIIKSILSCKMRRYFSLKNILDIIKFPIALLQGFFWVFILTPDIIFSKGGHGSFPAVFGGKILAVPIFLHESDVAPGRASRIEGKWAKEIFSSFSNTEDFSKDKTICVGHPIRKGLLQGSKEEAEKKFNIQGDKPILFIMGGSQGARPINQTLLQILPKMLRNFEIIHQIGERNFEQVKAEANAVVFKEKIEKYYHPYNFLQEEEMGQALGICNMVISRAGSGSIFAIARVGKPAILIPLKGSAGHHQWKNAYRFAEKGGGEVIEEVNLRPNFLLEKLKHIFSRIDLLKEMQNFSKEFARPQASKIISSYIMEYLFQATGKKNPQIKERKTPWEALKEKQLKKGKERENKDKKENNEQEQNKEENSKSDK